jgi:hypothetical protein
MDIKDRLAIAAEVLEESSIEGILTPEDIVSIADSTDRISPTEYGKVVGTAIYIQKRKVERLSRYEAFKAAFPSRCIVSSDDKDKIKTANGGFPTARKDGEELSKGSIVLKAKRLEETNLYKKLVLLLHTEVFVSYFIDRYKVIEEALKIALDENTPLRDKDRYMKLFLEETRKNEQMKGMEINVNIGNSSDIQSIEDKLNQLAHKLNGKSAGEIIDTVAIEHKEEA